MPRVKLRSDEQVLEATIGVMFAKGPIDFTLADVGAVAGIAPATLLQRFGDKRRLTIRAVALSNRKFATLLESAPREVGVEAVVDLFWSLTPGDDDEATLAEQLLWLHQDVRDPDLNKLACERADLLRMAVAQRLPPLAIDPDIAARLVEAQWCGALQQWGVQRRGRLADYVAESLAAWFDLAAPR
ncbi:TetR/AcrR family transcriptional regulator [Phenylobacterium sp.]|uniref:TetR/AcrR family transcriptional regulator n=1 Tax=Phenylobacterium sp. TaxID=1871053 RepID=UPI002734EC6E|nr:hypothetical protein [Phenylobacterium sp.]MDP3660480.1 hypothetical protein [Phenylobacterium sp.]